MKAILLAAGRGERLKPLTDNLPKCMMPIKGIPLLEVWLEKLVKANITEILINTHYLAEIVEKYVSKSKYKNICRIVFEETLLGTAGTLLKNKDFINNEECIIIHADNYCQEELTNFIDAHNKRPKKCLLSMLCFRTLNPRDCGIVLKNKSNILVGFHEKQLNPPGNLASGAIFILSSKFMTQFVNKFSDSYDFSKDVIPNLLNKVFIFETNRSFIDIGTIENYNKIKNG